MRQPILKSREKKQFQSLDTTFSRTLNHRAETRGREIFVEFFKNFKNSCWIFSTSNLVLNLSRFSPLSSYNQIVRSWQTAIFTWSGANEIALNFSNLKKSETSKSGQKSSGQPTWFWPGRHPASSTSVYVSIALSKLWKFRLSKVYEKSCKWKFEELVDSLDLAKKAIQL